VAKAVGYNDPYHFSRLFKKHMNVSPEQYKANNKEGA
jgi:AraC-like DNA-binding protein